MGKSILKALSVALLLSVALSLYGAENAPLIDRPKNMDTPSDEEKGILSTLVLIYTKTRNAVKFAYNEVMYFREMRQNFSDMQQWFDRAINRTGAIWDKTTQLWSDPKNVFVTLDRLEDIFNNIDYNVWEIPRELDQILARTELTYDDISSGTKMTAAMFPNTDEAIKYIDEKFGFNYLSNVDKSDLEAANKGRTARQGTGYKFPEEDLVTSSKLIAASTMASSEMYKNWAIKTSERMPKIDKNFEKVKGANGNELAACWYSIDETNANSRLLKNHLEELKLLQATLGIYVYESSTGMQQHYAFKNQMRETAQCLDEALQYHQ